MNRVLCLIGCFLISCTSCTEPAIMKPSIAPVVPIIDVVPEKPKEMPKVKPKLIWLDPSEAESLVNNNCFVLKFYSSETLENELLDKLLLNEEVILKINSFYIPVNWNDDTSDRDQLGFGIDDNFAGLMIVPNKDDVSAILVEVDKSTGNELPEVAAPLLVQVLNNMNCDKIRYSN